LVIHPTTAAIRRIITSPANHYRRAFYRDRPAARARRRAARKSGEARRGGRVRGGVESPYRFAAQRLHFTV
jgi:hypothetical protein